MKNNSKKLTCKRSPGTEKKESLREENNKNLELKHDILKKLLLRSKQNLRHRDTLILNIFGSIYFIDNLVP